MLYSSPDARIPRPPHCHLLHRVMIRPDPGFGIVLPILPSYAQRTSARVASATARSSACSPLVQFVATTLLGKLSDRVGRRPVLLTTMLINAVGYTLFAVSPARTGFCFCRVSRRASPAA